MTTAPPAPEGASGFAAELTTPPAALAVDLVGLILTGLSPQSASGYRKDFEAFRRFTGTATAEAALWGLLGLPRGPAHALALAYQADMTSRGLAAATAARRLAALRRAARRARLVGLTELELGV